MSDLVAIILLVLCFYPVLPSWPRSWPTRLSRRRIIVIRLHPPLTAPARPSGAGHLPRLQEADLALVFHPHGGDSPGLCHQAHLARPGLAVFLGPRRARDVFRGLCTLQRPPARAQGAGGLGDALLRRGGGGHRRKAGGAGQAALALALHPSAHSLAHSLRAGAHLGKRRRALGRAGDGRHLCALLRAEPGLLPAHLPAEGRRGELRQRRERRADPRAAATTGARSG